jgi:hypothetical protein
MDRAPDALNVNLFDLKSDMRKLGLNTALTLLDLLERPQLVPTVMCQFDYVFLSFL